MSQFWGATIVVLGVNYRGDTTFMATFRGDTTFMATFRIRVTVWGATVVVYFFVNA